MHYARKEEEEEEGYSGSNKPKKKKKERERILCLNFVCFASKVFLFFEYLSVINFY